MEGKNEDSQHDQASSCVPCQVEGKFDHWGRIDVDAECCQVAIEIQTEALPKNRYDGRRRNRLADWTIRRPAGLRHRFRATPSRAGAPASLSGATTSSYHFLWNKLS